VCVDCAEAACLDCEGNSKICNKCDRGYLLNTDGKCIDCDNKDYMECVECKAVDDQGLSTECTKCAVNHRLDPISTKCELCDSDGKCNSCTADVCTECADGTRLSNGICVPCT
jgi:hypothetical protein